MRYVAFAAYGYQFSNVSFESLTSEFDDLKILTSRKSIMWNGIYLFDCSDSNIYRIKNKLFPYFIVMEDF